jgi:hypothetical protein
MSILIEELAMSFHVWNDPHYVLEEVGNYYEKISVRRADRLQYGCAAYPPIKTTSDLPYSITL